MVDNFPRDSVIRRLNLEPAIMLGAGRALVLQLAHPNVAQGVQDHSDFKANPFKRLQGTLEATYAVVFGSRELAERVGRRIRWIHDFVTGPAYRANDPANLMWVHATLFDTALRCHETLLRPLGTDEAETYYQQMCACAEAFGCPRSEQPASLADFHAYFDEMVRGIDVTDVGAELCSYILDPELPWRLHVPFAPLLGMERRFTLGTLPAPIREQLGVSWTAADQRRFEQQVHRIRRTLRATPRAVRVAPNVVGGRVLTWQAERHVRAWEAQMAERGEAPATGATAA